ncbi:hypothetical protein H0H92_004578 [Tricholoma furcatifolium]|nr:hypothetical protein H0H92_004578 [Tricholoma furcatifolium]
MRELDVHQESHSTSSTPASQVPAGDAVNIATNPLLIQIHEARGRVPAVASSDTQESRSIELQVSRLSVGTRSASQPRGEITEPGQANSGQYRDRLVLQPSAANGFDPETLISPPASDNDLPTPSQVLETQPSDQRQHMRGSLNFDQSSVNLDATRHVSDDDKVNALIVRLHGMLSNEEEYRKLLSRTGSKAQKLLDMFQRLLDTSRALPSGFRSKLIAATQHLARKSELCPTNYGLYDVTDVSPDPEDAGRFADIYKGKFRDRDVCLKVIRRTTHVDMKLVFKVRHYFIDVEVNFLRSC